MMGKKILKELSQIILVCMVASVSITGIYALAVYGSEHWKNEKIIHRK
jgi:hypothetical protein